MAEALLEEARVATLLARALYATGADVLRQAARAHEAAAFVEGMFVTLQQALGNGVRLRAAAAAAARRRLRRRRLAPRRRRALTPARLPARR